MQDKPPTKPSPQSPADIAREAFRRLATRRIAPTPEAYREVYDEVAGTHAPTPAEAVLAEFANSLASAPEDIGRISKRLKEALEESDWHGASWQLRQLAGKHATDSNAETVAPEKLAIPVSPIEIADAAAPRAIDIPLVEKDDAPLPSRTIVLVDDAEVRHDDATMLQASEVEALPTPQGPFLDGNMTRMLREMLVRSLKFALSSLLSDAPALAKEADVLAEEIHLARNLQSLSEIEPRFKQFCFKVEMKSGDFAEERELLLRLFRLLIENIGELLEDDSWLSGQIANVQEMLAGPIHYASLMDATRSLKEVIYKQSMLKHSLAEAKARTKHLMLTTVERLGSVAASTDTYQQKIAGYLQKISTTDSAPELNKLLDDLVRDTRMAHIEAIRSHDELQISRTEMQAAEARIQELQTELTQMSELVREDQLTGSLNRRGLDEVLEREMERAARRQSSLCIAMLDLDDFKKLNDTHGHSAGDEALIHLVRVVKDTLRAMDVIARFGGEEFMIVLPDTAPSEAAQIVTRVQRELTKRIFMHNNERLLITFSAGVAMYAAEESQPNLIKRADEALYKAKKAGKNRVVLAD
jgi:diguanylate cyclase